MVGSEGGEPRFDQPPVRAVYLTVNFRPESHIQASHVAPLHALWSGEFPLVEERPPIVGPDGEGEIDLSPGADWPLPFTRYVSVEDDHSVAFQSDRFQVGWTFTLESGRRYPGFDHLADVLAERFDQFRDILSSAGVSLQLTGSECQYTNAFEGMSGPELAVGVLTDWSASPSGNLLPSEGYVGVRLHACPDEATHRCSSLLAIDGNSGEDAGMTVVVSRESEEAASLGGLRDAHEELIAIFLRHTPDHLHQKWGRTQ